MFELEQIQLHLIYTHTHTHRQSQAFRESDRQNPEKLTLDPNTKTKSWPGTKLGCDVILIHIHGPLTIGQSASERIPKTKCGPKATQCPKTETKRGGFHSADHRRASKSRGSLQPEPLTGGGIMPRWMLQPHLLTPMGQYDPQMALKEEPQMLSAKSSGCACQSHPDFQTRN